MSQSQSFYNPLAGCWQLPAFQCSPCAEPDGGRIRAIAFVRHGLPFQDISNPAEWQQYVAAGLAVVIPEVRGSYDGGQAVRSEGYGAARHQATGRHHSLSYQHTQVADNVPFYDILNYDTGWEVLYVTENWLWRTNAPASVDAGAPVEAALDSQLTWNVKVEWSQRQLPVPHAIPAGVFVCGAGGQTLHSGQQTQHLTGPSTLLLQTDAKDPLPAGEFHEEILSLAIFQSCGQPLTVEPWSIPEGFGVQGQTTPPVTFIVIIPMTIEAEVPAGDYELVFRVSGCGDPVFVTYYITLTP